MDRNKPNFGRVPIFSDLRQLTAKAVSVASGVAGRLWNLSRRQKEILIQGLVVSILVLPMIGFPYVVDLSKSGVNSGGSIGLLSLSEADKARQRYELVPSRGAEVQNPVLPPATPIEPAPAPEPQDPNLPPDLTQNTENIELTLLQRFDAFRTFIYQQHGIVLEIKSGWRSYEEQAQLYASLPRGYANPPGTSQHEKGNAIDYTPYKPEYNQHLAQFGLMLPFPGKENWHVEIVEPH